jgi:ACS family sodium-dependent inorganic phosphate cotransporter
VGDARTLDQLLHRQWESWYATQQATLKSSLTTVPSKPEKARQDQMMALLWAIACVSALDRVAMSIALLPMSVEYDLTDTIKGSMSSYFSLGYGFGIVPAGLLISKFSPKTVMAVGLTLWSLATLATPWAATSGASFAEFPLNLLLVRAAVGMGESVILPAVQRLLTQWTSVEEKASALATVISGFHVGTLAAYVLSPIVLEQTHTWRGLFDVYGSIGLLLLLPWWALATDSPEAPQADYPTCFLPGLASPRVSKGSRQPFMLSSSSSYPWTKKATELNISLTATWESALETLRQAPWKKLRESRAAWALLLAHCAKNWGLYNALSWTPTFYAEQYDLDVCDSAMLSVLPSITGAITVVFAGWLADAIGKQLDEKVRKGNDEVGNESARAHVRKSFQLVAFGGQGLALAALAANIPEHASVAQGFLMAAYGFAALNAAGFESGIQDKAGERWAGLLYSVTSLPAVLVGTVGVYVTGRILDLTNQDWSYVYGLNSIICFLGAAAFVALYDSKKEFE